MTAVALALMLAAPAAPPNVVMIVGDDQGWTDYGFMGSPHVQTPHLDKLAASGLTFRRGYVPTSLCRASLASMITGKYPHQHGITSNDPPFPPGMTSAKAANDPGIRKLRAAMAAKFARTPTLPTMLAPAGYVSHQSGKWWEGNPCRCGGFTESMTIGEPPAGRHGDAGLVVGRQGVKPVTAFIDAAAKDKKPFYVWYAPMMPHQPHNPPERLLKKYTPLTPSVHVAKYWAMCEWFDETVGDLLAHLDKTGLASNTLVVYLHDNGWIQDPDKGQFAAKSKKSPYDGGLRTPILVRGPGVPAGKVIDTPVSSLDVAATVIAAAGVKAELPGVNLLDATAVAKREAVFGATFEHNAVDLDKPAANLQHRWVVNGKWKLIVPNPMRVPNDVVELYDVLADPTETRNLAANTAEVARLRKLLDGWWDGR